jgi:predicted metal-dependent phosphoesterase TrpH
MILDLHTHTNHSFDGFTTQEELIYACHIRGINAIAITEHDEVCRLDSSEFDRHGIHLIPGCEYTTSEGAHIIGLFTNISLPTGSDRHLIFSSLEEAGSLVIMPHPFKPGSGYLSVYGLDETIEKFDLIERVNGGWKASEYISEIQDISEKFSIPMIGSSDSHRSSQVGLCVIKLKLSNVSKNSLQTNLKNIKQDDIAILIDRSILIKYGRKIRKFQKSTLYQRLLTFIPMRIRRIIKQTLYKLSKDRFLFPAEFEEISPWGKEW